MRDRVRTLAILTGAVLVAAAGAGLTSGSARADMSFDVVNGTVNAGSVYVVYFTGQFPNFTPGLVDSMFPFTHVHMDNSPSGEAQASPADTGQAGGFAVNQYNTGSPPPSPLPQPIDQPQYARSKYPPGNSSPVAFDSKIPNGPYARAQTTASSDTASAGGVNTTAPAGSSAASSARAGRISAFNLAMSGWRSRFMTPAAQSRWSGTAADPAQPDGTSGDAATSSVTVDPAKGVVAVADASIHAASFQGGTLALHGVHTAVTITNPGSPQVNVTTTVADASVAGVPVSIGAQGVTVGTPIVPADAVQMASQQLNNILTNAGITVAAIAPQVKNSGNEASVTATALSVSIEQAGPPRSVVRYNLGNVDADDLGVPSPPAAPAADLTPPVDNSTTGSTLIPTETTYIPGTPGTPAIPGTPGTTSPETTPPPTSTTPSTTQKQQLTPAAVSVPRGKPTWLLVAYLLWQALIIGAFASIWWWRSSARKLA